MLKYEYVVLLRVACLQTALLPLGGVIKSSIVGVNQSPNEVQCKAAIKVCIPV